MVLSRLDELSHFQLFYLKCAAVLGDYFNVFLLRKMLSDIPDDKFIRSEPFQFNFTWQTMERGNRKTNPVERVQQRRGSWQLASSNVQGESDRNTLEERSIIGRLLIIPVGVDLHDQHASKCYRQPSDRRVCRHSLMLS